MDRPISVFIFGLALLILQSTQGAELNSEATLNCNGKDFKCVNSTHYQPCSLTERSGQSPLWTINGVVLPCLAGQSCNDENTINCAVARTAQPNEMPSEIPVKVTVEQEPTAAAEKPSEEKPKEVASVASDEKPSETGPAKALPVEDMSPMEMPSKEMAKEEMPKEEMAKEEMPKEQMATPMPEMMPVSNLKGVPAEEPEKEEKSEKPVEKEEKPEKMEMSTVNASVADSTKAEPSKTSKKKFSFKGLKKVGPIRLVNGFRASSLRPKIALDSQKDVADNVREWLYERRNKYEKFVDTVLGKASPVGAKQPVPGMPNSDDQAASVSVVPGAPVPQETQREDICEDDDSCDDDYDTCDDGDDSCEDSSEDDDCEDSDSCEDDSSDDSCEDSDSCEDDDDDDDDCDEDELEPGEGEAVWEEEEVEGGIEIVEECPEDESDDCESSDSCASSDEDDYEYEDGISETAEVSGTDSDECDCSSDEASSSCGCDDDSESDEDDCDASDESEECKKKKKQKQDKKKKKKDGQKKKKKTGSKKSGSKKKADDKEKKAVEKKKVRYPPVQKIRKSLARALQNVTSAITKPLGRKANKGDSSSGSSSGGALSGVTSGIQNAFLNKVDGILSIKDNGLFNKGGNSDTNTGCSIVEGWSCPRQGRYAHPIDCQKYVQCSKSGVFSKELTNTVYECEDDEAYDPSQRACTTDWSSCEALEQCLYNRQLIEDPSDDSSYFICIRNSNKFKETYTVYRRDCTAGRSFDPDYQLCVNQEDYKKLAAEKKKRQRIRKQKQCKRKKAQKKKKGKKKSPKNKKTVRVHKTSQKKH